MSDFTQFPIPTRTLRLTQFQSDVAATKQNREQAQAASASSSASAGESANSAAAAATSAQQAADRLELIETLYLGDFAEAPTTNNAGNPLEGGELYFDTTLVVLRYYDGTLWNSIAAKTAAQTFADVLAQDGSGSGLDADLLDGMEASEFAAAVHTHAIAAITGLQSALDGKAAKASNLSDLTSAGAALDNLGIEAAPKANMTGADAPQIGNASVTDGSLDSGFYRYVNGASTGGPVAANGLLMHMRGSAGDETQLFFATGSNRLWFRARSGGSWVMWAEVTREGHTHSTSQITDLGEFAQSVEAFTGNVDSETLASGFYRVGVSATGTKPDGQTTFLMQVLRHESTGSRVGQIAYTDEGKGFLRTWNGSAWSVWGPLGGGGGLFRGDNGETGDAVDGPKDIFRVHTNTLNTNVTINSGENAMAAGPLTVATGVTLTVAAGGGLAIV